MSNRAALTEVFLESCRNLGPVRVVLRNSTGLSEVFADLSHLRVEGCWANLVLDCAHIHLTPKSFGAVAFRTAQTEAGAPAPAIWLYGSEGCPALLFVLDQLQGDALTEQLAAYVQLRHEFGPFMHLMSRHGIPEQVHVAPDAQACSDLH